MAGLQLAAVNTSVVALVAATPKTIVGVNAPTNQRVRILGWGVSFDGASGTAVPVVCRLRRHTTAGTSTTLTLRKMDEGLPGTIQSTAGEDYTVQPVLGDILDAQEVHPQTGYGIVFPLDWKFSISGAGRVSITCTAPAGVNVIGKIYVEE